jgi:hypothetical protein
MNVQEEAAGLTDEQLREEIGARERAYLDELHIRHPGLCQCPLRERVHCTSGAAVTYRTGQFTAGHAEALTGQIADVTEIDRDTGRTRTYHGAYILGLQAASLCMVVAAAEAEYREPALTGVVPHNIFLHDVHAVGGVLQSTASGWQPAE